MYHPAGAASAYGEPAEGPAEGKEVRVRWGCRKLGPCLKRHGSVQKLLLMQATLRGAAALC